MFQKSEEQSNGTTRQIISVLITDETDEVIGGFWHSAQSSQTGEQNFNFGLFFYFLLPRNGKIKFINMPYGHMPHWDRKGHGQNGDRPENNPEQRAR